MKNSVYLIRSQQPETDSRLQRYLLALDRLGIPYKVIAWDRKQLSDVNNKNYILFSHKAEIGGGFGNLTSLIKWNFFILVTLIKNSSNLSTIHAIDFDSIIPSFLLCKLFNKRIVFDIYDKYSDTRLMPEILGKIVSKIELFIAIHSDGLILPDVCRKKQLGLLYDVKVAIIENVPYVKGLNVNVSTENDKKIILAYVGILEKKNRGIEDLLSAVAGNTQFQLRVAGDGPLKEYVENYANKYENIEYIGLVKPEEAISILQTCSVQIGLYYKTVKNHYYAAPNKYYEHLFAGKALLTTEGTPPGDKVVKYNTGYAIGEGKDAICSWLNSCDMADIIIKSNNASMLWINNYSNYFESKFVPVYSEVLGISK